MGVGVIVGAGIFVLTGSAAAQFAGPAIIISFALAAFACSLSALCYAEFSSLLPVSGSAYAYAYATLGELVAWVIGWNIVMEYVFAASYVAVGWSGYAQSLLASSGIHLPSVLAKAPFDSAASGLVFTGGLINLPAIAVVMCVYLIARTGIGLSATVNAVIVSIKLGALLLFVLFGARFIQVSHWTPFLPQNTGEFGHYGWSGVLRGAAVVFVAYLGFDALSTTAQETRDPQRNLPIGILGSLAVCTMIYAAVSLVLTGIVSYRQLNVPNPLSVALRAAGGELNWLVPIVDIAAIGGLASVLLVIMLAQPRVLLAMANDGLLPPALARIHPRFHTPSTGTLITGCAVAFLSGLFPIGVLVQLVSLGTLSVFIAVCVGVLVLRRIRPELLRPFRVPFAPIVCGLGAVVCAYLLVGLPRQAWLLYAVWTAIGAAIYASYGRRSATRTRVQTSE